MYNSISDTVYTYNLTTGASTSVANLANFGQLFYFYNTPYSWSPATTTERLIKYTVSASNGLRTLDWYQTSWMNDFIASDQCSTFDYNTCLLFDLVDVKTATPLFNVKFYYEGFMTCPILSAATNFEFKDIKLAYVGQVSRFFTLKAPTSAALLNTQVQQSIAQLQALMASPSTVESSEDVL